MLIPLSPISSIALCETSVPGPKISTEIVPDGICVTPFSSITVIALSFLFILQCSRYRNVILSAICGVLRYRVLSFRVFQPFVLFPGRITVISPIPYAFPLPIPFMSIFLNSSSSVTSSSPSNVTDRRVTTLLSFLKNLHHLF